MTVNGSLLCDSARNITTGGGSITTTNVVAYGWIDTPTYRANGASMVDVNNYHYSQRYYVNSGLCINGANEHYATAYYTISTEQQKHSIKQLDFCNCDILDKINQINVYTFCYKKKIEDTDDEATKTNKYFFTKKKQFGLIAEEVIRVLPDASNKYVANEIDEKAFNEQTNGYVPTITDEDYIETNKSDLSINYNVLTFYNILAIQQLNKKVIKQNEEQQVKINEQQEKITELETKHNEQQTKILALETKLEMLLKVLNINYL
jgi:hypothetical protein